MIYSNIYQRIQMTNTWRNNMKSAPVVQANGTMKIIDNEKEYDHMLLKNPDINSLFFDFNKKTENLHNWLDDQWIGLPDTNSYWENDNFEGEDLNLKTISDQNALSQDEITELIYEGHPLAYQIFGNAQDRYDRIKANDWVMCSPRKDSYGYLVTRNGDYVTGCRLTVPTSDNVNRWLLSKLSLDIGGIRILQGTLMLLHALSERLDESNKITTDVFENRTTIPLSIFELIGSRRLDLIPIQFDETRIILDKPNYEIEPLGEPVLHLCYGYYELGLRSNVVKKKRKMLTLQTTLVEEEIKDDITVLKNMLTLLNVFVVVWYIVDTSEYGETQNLQPDIMYVNIEFTDINGISYEKTINLSKIKKIKVGNFIGYVIPTSHMDLDEVVQFIKQTDETPDSRIIGEQVNWSITDRDKITISWSNYQPGSKIYAEFCRFNIGRMMDGTFNLVYAN